jgi:hypothetical protein
MYENLKKYFLKSIPFIIWILIISNYLFLDKIIYYIPNFFSENSAFYFYSSILQANAAIFSIVGVFYIFKIQSLNSSIDIIKSALISDQGRNSWPSEIIDWSLLTLGEKEKNIKDGTANKYIIKSLTTWASLERQIESFKKVIILPSLLLSFGILFESLSLFSAYYIHNQFAMIEYYVAHTNLLVEIFIVIYVTKNILSFFK